MNHLCGWQFVPSLIMKVINKKSPKIFYRNLVTKVNKTLTFENSSMHMSNCIIIQTSSICNYISAHYKLEKISHILKQLL